MVLRNARPAGSATWPITTWPGSGMSRMSLRWLRAIRRSALGRLRLVIRGSGLGLERERSEERKLAWEILLIVRVRRGSELDDETNLLGTMCPYKATRSMRMTVAMLSTNEPLQLSPSPSCTTSHARLWDTTRWRSVCTSEYWTLQTKESTTREIQLIDRGSV
jgi:hypothetical protein